MAVPTQETKGIRIHSVKASREDASIASQNNFLMPGKNLIYGLMGFLLVYAIVRSLVAAAERPFWFDELMTLTVSARNLERHPDHPSPSLGCPATSLLYDRTFCVGPHPKQRDRTAVAFRPGIPVHADLCVHLCEATWRRGRTAWWSRASRLGWFVTNACRRPCGLYCWR